jgi:hypothetical protein
LIKDFSDKNMNELASSGIAADYSEKDQLLSDISTAIVDKDEEDKMNREERAANERKLIAAGETIRASALKRRSTRYQRESITERDGDLSRPSRDENSEDGPTTAPANKKRRSSSESAASVSYEEDEQGEISELLRESLSERKKDRENAEKRLSLETRRLDLEERRMDTERDNRILEREEKRAMIEF